MAVPNALIISDTQAPAHCQDAIPFLAACKEKIKPDIVCHVGDECDLTQLSRSFKPNPNLQSPADELESAKEFLDELEQLFPTMYLCYSNHGARIWKKAHDAGIPNAYLKTPKEIYNKPNWEWAADWWLKWAGGDVCVTHGDRKKGAAMYARTLGASVISGHQHSMMGISYQNSRHQTTFGMDVGCLCDANHGALAYAQTSPLGQLLGCGAILDGYPTLLMMGLDTNGRWDGTVSGA